MFIPNGPKGHRDFCYDFIQLVSKLKYNLEQEVSDCEFRMEKLEMIEFLKEELLHQKTPRHYLVKTIITTLNEDPLLNSIACYKEFRDMIMDWLDK